MPSVLLFPCSTRMEETDRCHCMGGRVYKRNQTLFIVSLMILQVTCGGICFGDADPLRFCDCYDEQSFGNL
eukprot:IDg2415t1